MIPEFTTYAGRVCTNTSVLPDIHIFNFQTVAMNWNVPYL